ncbi:MAG: FeoB-associated Cys-rich membrane protein [Clostridiales bacterium]|nr:FeoB-associated Cys-rich membrane protein [Candidatus Coliplasma equi]
MKTVIITALLIILLSAATFFALRSIIKNKTLSKCPGCSGDCKNCNKKGLE